MTDRLLQFFAFAHLKPELAAVSKPFDDLASWIVENLPQNPERTVALRKLLEAKDCAVRCKLGQWEERPGRTFYPDKKAADATGRYDPWPGYPDKDPQPSGG